MTKQLTHSSAVECAPPGKFKRYHPVQRMLLIGFLVVALLPLSALAYKLYQVAWDDAWREVREKHQLLAQNLTAPLGIYVKDQRDALGLLADFLELLVSGREASALAPQDFERLRGAMSQLNGFSSITLVSHDGRILASTAARAERMEYRQAYAQETCFLRARDKGLPTLSAIKASPLFRHPTLVMSQPVHHQDSSLGFVLMGELKVEIIEQLRRQIKFGRKGHSAIVDKNGHVIAHPNPKWMLEMRDLSKLPVIQAMMRGETGTTEFYSPFIKQNMVVGYAAVPDLGWGVMVPQPKGEIEEHVRQMLLVQAAWGLAGLLLAVVLAIVLTRWITSPLKQLCSAVGIMMAQGYRGHLPSLEQGPREAHQLRDSFAQLVDGLQQAHTELDTVNQNLQARIDAATTDLREANNRLERIASVDYLTKLANRRFFESALLKSLQNRRRGDNYICLILIDVDNFKTINDTYGHAAGDSILVQLAGLLNQGTRQTDLAARYAGDEFVIKMYCTREVGRQRAEHLLREIEAHHFIWDNRKMQVTVSIGLQCTRLREGLQLDDLLRQVDNALYAAKAKGRNCLVELEEAV